MNFVSARGDRRLLASGFAFLALVALLAFAARAQAVETLYWDNYGGSPDNVSFAGIDGSGGGTLNTGALVVNNPEGLAYDTVTNRLFTTSGTGPERQILAINLDGSGASSFTAPGAPIEAPEGVAIDPVSRTIYWINTGGEGSIAWANLDGSIGGVLSTAGATVDNPCCRPAVDPAGGRIYWTNFPSGGNGVVSYANLNNTGGGDLNLTGTTVEPGGEGIVVDDAAGRLYYLGGNAIGFANLNGSGGDVSVGTGVINGPWGLAFDPTSSTIYWGNESNGEERTNAFGFVNLAGVGGGISIATAPIANPQDPVILKSPTGTGAPVVTRSAKARSQLTCSTGGWAADYPGGFVYQAPRTFAYQWTRNGSAIAGATGSTFSAKSAGSYGCGVTATNQTGSAAQTSAPVKVKAAKLKLSTKKKAGAAPGQAVSFRVKATNQGDIQAKKAKVCAKLPKSAKGELKAPKCKSLGKLKGRGKKSVTLKIGVLPSAGGTYKVTFQVKGAPGKAAKSRIVVG